MLVRCRANYSLAANSSLVVVVRIQKHCTFLSPLFSSPLVLESCYVMQLRDVMYCNVMSETWRYHYTQLLFMRAVQYSIRTRPAHSCTTLTARWPRARAHVVSSAHDSNQVIERPNEMQKRSNDWVGGGPCACAASRAAPDRTGPVLTRTRFTEAAVCLTQTCLQFVYLQVTHTTQTTYGSAEH